MVDDVDSPEDNACAVNAATQFIAISGSPSKTAPVIYLSHDGPADYRIFVKSRTFTARDAAALIVGASGGHPASRRIAVDSSLDAFSWREPGSTPLDSLHRNRALTSYQPCSHRGP